MSLARKDPDVSFQVREKLNIDVRLIAGYEIPERIHRVLRGILSSHVPQRIARTRGHNAVIRVDAAGSCANLPAGASPVQPQNPSFLYLRSGIFRTAKQHPVQFQARIDYDGAIQLHLYAPSFGRGNQRVGYKLSWSVVLQQIRILAVCLVGDPAATGLLPCQFFIDNDRAQSGARKSLSGGSASGASS